MAEWDSSQDILVTVLNSAKVELLAQHRCSPASLVNAVVDAACEGLAGSTSTHSLVFDSDQGQLRLDGAQLLGTFFSSSAEVTLLLMEDGDAASLGFLPEIIPLVVQNAQALRGVQCLVHPFKTTGGSQHYSMLKWYSDWKIVEERHYLCLEEYMVEDLTKIKNHQRKRYRVIARYKPWHCVAVSDSESECAASLARMEQYIEEEVPGDDDQTRVGAFVRTLARVVNEDTISEAVLQSLVTPMVTGGGPAHPDKQGALNSYWSVMEHPELVEESRHGILQIVCGRIHELSPPGARLGTCLSPSHQ